MSEPKFTKGPWSLCGAERGGCCCFTVGSPHHPIADITHGEWGDEYVNIRLIDNPNGITKLAEAFMDHSWYGEVPDEQDNTQMGRRWALRSRRFVRRSRKQSQSLSRIDKGRGK